MPQSTPGPFRKLDAIAVLTGPLLPVPRMGWACGGGKIAAARKLIGGGTLVTIATPPKVRPRDGRAVFFVVEPDRARLADLARRLRDGRLKPIVGAVRTLREAPSAFAPGRRTPGKTIIKVTEDRVSAW